MPTKKISWLYLFAILGFMTACDLSTPSPATVDISLSASELSVTKGGEASIFIDFEATNSLGMELLIMFNSSLTITERNNINVSFPDPPDLFNCPLINAINVVSCDYYGSSRGPMSFTDIEVKFSISEEYNLGDIDFEITGSVIQSNFIFTANRTTAKEPFKLMVTSP